MKKLIASLLTVATVASMASMSAFAAETKADVAGDFDTTAYIGDDAATTYDDVNNVIEVKPGKTLYYKLTDTVLVTGGSATAGALNDGDSFKAKFDKGDDNTKMIKKMSLTEKSISGDRGPWLKVELNDDMTDKEYKVKFSVTFTSKEAIVGTTDTAIIGSKVTFTESAYISNKEVPGDKDWDAGEGGFIAKPEKNDDNEITWADGNSDIAKLTFEGDSDVSKYYPKLSTKWDNADYAENFADTDAFIRSFVGNPTISATSRPVLELYNPFIDEDGDETVAAEDVVIYEVVDGALVDVTEKFTAGENDDGDSVFTIKTRTLGTYIFSNGAAVATEEAPAEEAPTDVKENPGTGRF